MNNHVMLDLEGLGGDHPIIISVGAVQFNPVENTLGDPFYVEICQQGVEEQIAVGRTMSLSTLQWWMLQSEEAQSVFVPKREQLTTGRMGFHDPDRSAGAEHCIGWPGD